MYWRSKLERFLTDWKSVLSIDLAANSNGHCYVTDSNQHFPSTFYSYTVHGANGFMYVTF